MTAPWVRINNWNQIIPKMFYFYFYFYNFIFCENFCDWPKGDEIISSGLDQSKFVVYEKKTIMLHQKIKTWKKVFASNIYCLQFPRTFCICSIIWNFDRKLKIENWNNYTLCAVLSISQLALQIIVQKYDFVLYLSVTPEGLKIGFFLLAMHETKDRSTFLIKGEGKWRPSKLDLVLFGLRSDRFIMQQKMSI